MTDQPFPTPPSTCSGPSRTPSRKTSQNSSEPVISRIGRIVMPGSSMGTTKAVNPAWRSTLGSVRARSIPMSAHWASVHQVFCPVTTKWSSSGSARVRRDARSLPAPGSLKSWHQMCSPLRIRGRYRDFCSRDPNSSRAWLASMT